MAADGELLSEVPKDLTERTMGLVKSYFLGAESMNDSEGTNSLSDPANEESSWTQAGAIPPPYDAMALMKLLEHSNALRQNIDAYATNIDGFGHRIEPVIDLEAEDAATAVRDQIVAERVRLMERVTGGTVALPTDEEVQVRTEALREQMRLEKLRIDAFFDQAAGDLSFVGLRRRLRQDLELTGNAFMEVVRTAGGEILEFVHLPCYSIRLRKIDASVEVEMPVRGADLQYRTSARRRRFRTFVQLAENKSVFFKEFGDPRVVSSKTGQPWESLAEMTSTDNEGPDTRAATEVIHFRIYSSRSAYGIPRWIGNLLAVLGSRAAEETNYLYFDNKSIPPLAVLVSGGRFSADSVKRIEDYIKNEIKGRRNFHKILVLEAEGAGGAIDSTGRMKIEIKPLTDSQQKDGLFQAYDERNIDKVGMSFRLPRLLRGDIRDFNRATADAAVELAETQVFAPERNDFDHFINQKVMSDLRVRLWSFVSNGPTTQDASELAIIVERLVKADVLIPEEAREVAEKILGRRLNRIDADWVRQPTSFTKAGIALDTAADQQLMLPPASAPSAAPPGAPAPQEGTEPAPAPGAPAPAIAAAQAFQAALRPKKFMSSRAGITALSLLRMRDDFRNIERLEAARTAMVTHKRVNTDGAGDPERGD